jgi:succinylglutamate desuccinylase
MPRGGKRPGAGAPKGNLNAFRTGKTSRQYKQLLEIISADPEAMRLVREIALGNEKLAARRRRYAMQVLNRLLQRFEDQANDRLVEAWERSRAIPPLD